MKLSFVRSIAVVLLGSMLVWSCSNEPGSGKSKEALDLAKTDNGVVVDVIATGANIAGANGVGLGPDGHLYVASVLGSNITVLDTESGEAIKVYGLQDGVLALTMLLSARTVAGTGRRL